MFEWEVRNQIDIAASPEAVWKVLTRFDRWGEWNSTIPKVELRGPLRPRTRAKLTLALPLVGRQHTVVKLEIVNHARELRWVGGLRGLFVGRHGFRLEPTAEGTRFHHREEFSGVVAPLTTGWLGKHLEQAYRDFNEGLRRCCERGGD